MLNCYFGHISSGAFKRDGEDDSAEILKSIGIDREGGFVFALDTMRVMMK